MPILYAVFEQENETWYFKKAFTSWNAANNFLFLHTHMTNPLKVVPYGPLP